MSETISVSKISEYVEKEVTIKGWVYNRTHKGKLVFLLVRDGSGFVQCVAFKGDLEEEVFDQLTRIPQESSVIIKGSVREDKRAPGLPGGYEIGVKQIEVVQEADLDYPMSLKDHGVDFALDNRHLWIRMQSQWAILKVRVKVISAVREYLDGNGFFNLDTPILTPAAAEGTTTLFETAYFDEGAAYLAQTQAARNRACHRPNWKWEDHVALRGVRPQERHRGEDRDSGRSGRVPPAWHHAGARAKQGRRDVRKRAQEHPPTRP
jgi:asparaginyl-tRNA synthetase